MDRVNNNNSYSRSFTYDASGNIKTSTTYVYYYSSAGYRNGEQISYSYSTGQWKDQLTGTTTKTYTNGVLTATTSSPTITYNADGNMTSHPVQGALTWAGNQLMAVSGVSANYSYDKNGLRTGKDNWRYYYNNGQLERIEGVGGNAGITMKLLYDAAGKPWSLEYTGSGVNTWFYYEYNGQGDVVGILNNNNQKIADYRYDAWGKPLSITPNAAGSTTLPVATAIANNQPFRYRGYVYDNETGWYYLKSRYYDPSLRRFISSDVLMSTGQGLLGLNMYAYCGNNPISRSDPTGQIWEIDGVSITIGKDPAKIQAELQLKAQTRRNTRTNRNGFQVNIAAFEDTMEAAIKLLGLAKVSEIIGLTALEQYKRQQGREFLFSDGCVIYEVDWHIRGYRAAQGTGDPGEKRLLQNFYSNANLIDRCGRIDIFSTDADRASQEFVFNYINGIRDCYYNTASDPYFNRRTPNLDIVKYGW